jgi:hypothetical protein
LAADDMRNEKHIDKHSLMILFIRAIMRGFSFFFVFVHRFQAEDSTVFSEIVFVRQFLNKTGKATSPWGIKKRR